MDTNASNTQEVEDLYQRLTLEEDEGEVLEYNQVRIEGNKKTFQWSIFSRFTTDLFITFQMS